MSSASTSALASKPSKSAKSSKSTKPTTESTSTSSKPAKSSSKSKAKSKATVTETSDDVPVEARNEGVEPTWEYKPPAKFASVHDAKGLEFEFGDFDWDSVKKDEEVEVWLVRVPESVKPKHLKGVHLTLPKPTTTTTATPAKPSPSSSSSSSLDSSSDSDSSAKPSKSKSKTSKNTNSSSNVESGPTKIGSLDRKDRTYDIWSLPAVSPREANAQNKRSGDEDGEDGEDKSGATMIEGEELRTLNVLLPKAKKGGKLYLAPKPIARHIVFSAPPALPVSTPKTEASPAALYQNPPRHAYPPELLKHRFRPYGVRGHAEGEGGGNIAAMDVDREVGEEKEGAERAGKEKEKGKKRKAETSPKKSKKVKTQ